jgi:type II secretory pathway pseudopilin PulG
LAEVLITLGIIGIVAAMTIPTLMNNIQETQYKTAYKKAFSVASQTWLSALNDNKLVDLPGTEAADNQAERLNNFAAFKSYFKVAKSCGDAATGTLAPIADCWASGDMWWGIFPNSPGVGFIDNSGFAWVLVVAMNTSNTNEIAVDINGNKPPNKFGIDRFDLIPTTNDNIWHGTLTKIIPHKDCLSTTDCPDAEENYINVCPNVATHPCYYTSWLFK